MKTLPNHDNHSRNQRFSSMISFPYSVAIVVLLLANLGCSTSKRASPSPAPALSASVTTSVPPTTIDTAFHVTPPKPLFVTACDEEYSYATTSFRWDGSSCPDDKRYPLPIDFLPLFPNLRELYLEVHASTDLRPLAALPYLERLSLDIDKRKNELFDLTPLGELSSLLELDLHTYNFYNLEVFARLNWLRKLTFRGEILPKKQNIRIHPVFIRYLTNLESLTLHNLSQSFLEDVVSHLTNLRELSIPQYGTGPTDLRPLSKLQHLETLHLLEGEYNDLSPLASLSHLKVLVLNHFPHSNIEALYSLRSLKQVTIYDTPSKRNFNNYLQLRKHRPDISTIWMFHPFITLMRAANGGSR
jgi:Leucine-rich repeat (LRR) protein